METLLQYPTIGDTWISGGVASEPTSRKPVGHAVHAQDVPLQPTTETAHNDDEDDVDDDSSTRNDDSSADTAPEDSVLAHTASTEVDSRWYVLSRDSADINDSILAPDRISAKVAIVSMFKDGAAALKARTMENKRDYAARHGYDFIDAYEDPALRPELDNPANNRDVFFLKFRLLRHYLDRYDYLLWLDGDTLFLNHSRSLVDAGVLDPQFDMVVPVGHSMDWYG